MLKIFTALWYFMETMNINKIMYYHYYWNIPSVEGIKGTGLRLVLMTSTIHVVCNSKKIEEVKIKRKIEWKLWYKHRSYSLHITLYTLKKIIIRVFYDHEYLSSKSFLVKGIFLTALSEVFGNYFIIHISLQLVCILPTDLLKVIHYMTQNSAPSKRNLCLLVL